MQARDGTDDLTIDQAPAWLLASGGSSADARGKLLERYRDYLLLVAERELEPGLRPKIGASDLVQLTLLDAERGLSQFRGQTEQELRAWLRRILRNQAGQAVRHYVAAKRDVRIERSLTTLGEESPGVHSPGGSQTPSRQLAAAEEAHSLAAALLRLPEHYRQVIELRNMERKPFDAIGALMDRSPEAARKLWVRAVEQLRVELDIRHESRTTD
jgi:RNA polymerase sigma-70 factor (ECF subfamily)